MIVILSTECNQQKLTNSSFGHSLQKYLTDLKIYSRSKDKNTPHFCLKMTKSKQNIEKPQWKATFPKAKHKKKREL
jgi:hypothetical protein